LMKQHEPNYPKKAAKLVLSLFGLAFLISA
jgi:hypothetical protein